MQLETWLAFLVASFLISLSPGAGAISCMAAGLRYGFRRAAWNIAGLIVGILFVLSIVAGLSIRSIEQAAGEKLRIIRVMPNTPALVLSGASAFALGTQATEADAEIAQKIFGVVGVALRAKEALLDAVTGLSGSGPAYVYTIIEAMADGGVLMGLPRELRSRSRAMRSPCPAADCPPAW